MAENIAEVKRQYLNNKYSMDRGLWYRVLRLTKVVYTPLSLVFIIILVHENFSLLKQLISTANPIYLSLSIVIWGFLHLISPLFPKIVLTSLGDNTTYRQLLTIHVSRLPARYLPGGIWYNVGRYSDYYKLGISKNRLVFLAFFGSLVPCFVTLSLGGGYIWLTGKQKIIYTSSGSIALLAFIMIFFTPIALKFWSKSKLPENFLPYYFLVITISSLFWCIASVSFVLYYSSLLTSLAKISLLKVAFTYIFSWGIGYISIFAPQGIGVFELVGGKILELPISLGGSIAFFAGFRLVSITADIAVWSFFTFFRNLATNGS